LTACFRQTTQQFHSGSKNAGGKNVARRLRLTETGLLADLDARALPVRFGRTDLLDLLTDYHRHLAAGFNRFSPSHLCECTTEPEAHGSQFRMRLTVIYRAIVDADYQWSSRKLLD
jgi:hypothetical protein